LRFWKQQSSASAPGLPLPGLKNLNTLGKKKPTLSEASSFRGMETGSRVGLRARLLVKKWRILSKGERIALIGGTGRCPLFDGGQGKVVRKDGMKSNGESSQPLKIRGKKEIRSMKI